MRSLSSSASSSLYAATTALKPQWRAAVSLVRSMLNKRLLSQGIALRSLLKVAALVGGSVAVFCALREFYIRKHEKQMRGQVVLITGGGSGIGRLMGIKLAKEGAKVVLWDVNAKGLEETETTIKAFGGFVRTYVVDVTDYKKVYATADLVRQEVGDVTILINNAGIVSGKSVLELREEQMELTMKVNTISHFWTVRAFLPRMIEMRDGHIVTISSAAGIAGAAGLSDYSASKFGAFGFAEALRMELRKKGHCGGRGEGVQSLTVCPYYINTGMFDGVKTKFPMLLPILDPDYVSDRIIRSIKRSDTMLVLPSFIWITYLFRFLFPGGVCDRTSEILGVSDSMSDFKGRGNNNTKQ